MDSQTTPNQDARSDAQVAANAAAALDLLLRKTRSAYLQPLVFEFVLWLGATLMAVMLSAGVLSAVVPRNMGPTVFSWVLGVGIVATTIVAGITAAIAWRRYPDLTRVAHWLQNAEPQFRSDIVAAVQFARELQGGPTRYSASMALEHVQRTLRLMHERVDGRGSLAHLLPSRSLRPAGFAFMGGLLMVIAMANLLPNFGGHLVREATMLAIPNARPVVGDIDVVLEFPSYTHLPPESESFSTGNIDAIAGTEVTLRTYALIDATRIEIELTTDGETRTVPVKETRSGLLEARFVATQPGTYKFRATQADGKVVDDSIIRTINLRPDLPPKVNITSHAGEVEVSPGEVLEIKFSASDDFGIQSIARLYGFPGEEPTRVAPPIPTLNELPTELEATMKFDLSVMNLQPKDTVVFQLEIIDNNTLTGPGRTLSQELVLRVASPDDKHQKIVERQQELAESLVMLLGDFLETPLGERSARTTNWVQTVPPDLSEDERKARLGLSAGLSKKTAEVLAVMKTLSEDMAKDPLMIERDAMIFTGLYTQLAELHQDHAETVARLEPLLKLEGPSTGQLGRLATHQTDHEEALEKGILRLEDLLASQRMEMVKATTEEIKALKDRLRELLEKYRDTQDPELKEAIKREIGRLRQRMAELMKRMQDQLHRLPEEHVNMDAMAAQQLESDAKKMADAMTSIEEMLDKGDIDGALAALDQMDTSLDELTKEMNKEFGEAQPDSMTELDKKISELMDDVNDLEALQQEVEKQTQEAHQENLRQVEEKLNDMVQKATGPIIEDIRAQKKALQQMKSRQLSDHEADEAQRAIERLDGLERALRQGDIEQAAERANQSVEDMRSLQFGLELATRYTKPNSRQSQDLEKSRSEMPGMISRGQEIRNQLGQLKEKARQQMASPNQQMMEGLGEGQQQVSDRAQKFSEKLDQASKEFPMLQQQMKPSSDAAQQKMGEAGSKLGKGQLQPALDQQRQALEELRKLKESMRDTLKREKQGNNGRTTQEKVEIPEQEDRAKETYRDDVMKNMREGRLENYDDEIRRYYESLME
ncbi:MAG: DUF4175 family protein [bacterium]